MCPGIENKIEIVHHRKGGGGGGGGGVGEKPGIPPPTPKYCKYINHIICDNTKRKLNFKSG